MIRFFDLLFSFLALFLLFPVFVLISFLIVVSSRGGIFYCQYRVGKHFKPFLLYKFRTMYVSSDVQGLLTIGDRDFRVTAIGFFIRKYKLDELPQLINVIKGDMSLVGPRPEVQKYVSHYNVQQKRVLDVLPGITDYASIAFRNESGILEHVQHPEEYYIRHIMPRKICLSLSYIDNKNLKTYFFLLFKTLKILLFR